MPWCDACAKYFAPNTMRPNGACPECERVLVSPGMLRAEARSIGVSDPTLPRKKDGTPTAPWHFKLMLVAVTAYLGWRFVQMVLWFF